MPFCSAPLYVARKLSEGKDDTRQTLVKSEFIEGWDGGLYESVCETFAEFV